MPSKHLNVDDMLENEGVVGSVPADRSVLVRWEIEHGHSPISRYSRKHSAGPVGSDCHQH